MVKTETAELITNDILVSWEEGVQSGSGSLLAGLNGFLSFLEEYDRYLARAVGCDCELDLYLDSLEETGFRFTLRYCLIPSGQLFLGQGETDEAMREWLVQMHLELLSRLGDTFEEDELLKLIGRAADRADAVHLEREIYFSLEGKRRCRKRLEKCFSDLRDIRDISRGMTLKIQKK